MYGSVLSTGEGTNSKLPALGDCIPYWCMLHSTGEGIRRLEGPFYHLHCAADQELMHVWARACQSVSSIGPEIGQRGSSASPASSLASPSASQCTQHLAFPRVTEPAYDMYEQAYNSEAD